MIKKQRKKACTSLMCCQQGSHCYMDYNTIQAGSLDEKERWNANEASKVRSMAFDPKD